MPRPWIAWLGPSRKGGIFDVEASSSVSITLTRADAGNPGPSSTGSGDSIDLETSEDLEHERSPGGTRGVGSTAHACTCDLDECPHRLDIPGRRHTVERSDPPTRRWAGGGGGGTPPVGGWPRGPHPPRRWFCPTGGATPSPCSPAGTGRGVGVGAPPRGPTPAFFFPPTPTHLG